MSSIFSLHPTSSTDYSTPSSIGLGKSPKLRSRFHTAKPYARSTSTSTKRTKKSHQPTSKLDVLQPIKAQSKRHARSILGDWDTEQKENVRERERKEVDLIKGMKSMGVETQTKGAEGVPTKPEGFAFVYIPLGELAQPDLPPIPNIRANGQDIPAEYVRSKISPLFPEYLIISNMYKPYLQYSFPSPQATSAQLGLNIRHLDDHFSEIAMGVPAVVDAASKGIEHPWIRKMYGRNPDGILNVREIGKEGNGVIFPVNVVVYMSQCAFWHEVLEKGRRTRWAGQSQGGSGQADADNSSQFSASVSTSSSSSTSSSAASVISELSDHTVIAEDFDIKPTFKVEPPSPPSSSPTTTLDDHLSTETVFTEAETTYLSDTNTSSTTLSSSSTLNESLPGASLHLLHLPLLPIYIPHLATFNSLHLYLHQPTTNPLPHILQIDPHLCINTETLDPYLHTLPVAHLMEMMRRVDGFWLNCMTLGVSDGRIKGWVEYAWGILRWVLKRRSRRVEASGEGEFLWDDYWKGQ